MSVSSAQESLMTQLMPWTGGKSTVENLAGNILSPGIPNILQGSTLQGMQPGKPTPSKQWGLDELPEDFTTAGYLKYNPELKTYYQQHPEIQANDGSLTQYLINHYGTYGQYENRRYKDDPIAAPRWYSLEEMPKDWTVKGYLKNNPDVLQDWDTNASTRTKYGTLNQWALNHYGQYGKNEGRTWYVEPTPETPSLPSMEEIMSGIKFPEYPAFPAYPTYPTPATPATIVPKPNVIRQQTLLTGPKGVQPSAAPSSGTLGGGKGRRLLG
jgi:hypothetical protein